MPFGIGNNNQSKLISVYVRERKRYKLDELSEILQYSKLRKGGDDRANECIRKLMNYGVLKVVNGDENDDISEEAETEEFDYVFEDPFADKSKCRFQFSYVGIIVIDGRVIKCYPKYITPREPTDDEFSQIIKVIEKSNGNDMENVVLHANSSKDSSYNLLAILYNLLKLYNEHGTYAEMRNTDGDQDSIFDGVMNVLAAFFRLGSPWDDAKTQTRRQRKEEKGFFNVFHKCLLTIASRQLKEAGLLDIFGMDEVNISNDKLKNMGTVDELLEAIDEELEAEENAYRRTVLFLMRAHVSCAHLNFDDQECFACFGTTKFENVWEKVCSDIFDNKLDSRMTDLKLPRPLLDNYKRRGILRNCIETPRWSESYYAQETLRPDIVCIDGDKFVILDAKYYMPIFNKGQRPKFQPGVESVAKQYLYQLAFNDFTTDHGFKDIENCFLLPTGTQYVVDKGTVSMSIFTKMKSLYPNLDAIKVRFIPAAECYSLYLEDKKMDLNRLKLSKF